MSHTAELPIYTGEGPTRPTLGVESSELRTLVVAGRRIAYIDVGPAAAPAVILAHSSGGSHRQWKGLVAQLSQRYRVIAPDLIGYGASEPWLAGAPLPAEADAEVLVKLSEHVDWPAHLVGHSYGGAAALDAARRLGPRVRSLTLIEPVAFHLLLAVGRMAEWNEIVALGERVATHVRLRRERSAAREFYRYWIGQLGWWMMPARARRRCVATIAKVAAEFEMLHARRATASDYLSIHSPTRLIVGSRTKQPARAVVEELLMILPNATARTLEGAGHMSPLTRPDDVNELVADHIDGVQSAARRWRRTLAQLPQLPERPYSVRSRG